MDILFEIIVPKLPHIEGLEPQQFTYEWSGVAHLQGSTTFRWGNIELVPDQVQPWLLRFLPNNYVSDQWLWLQISSSSLELLEKELNGEPVDWSGRHLEDLLKLILSENKKWVLIFEPNYDEIDSAYNLDVVGCINKLKSNLKWGAKREGFIAFA